MAFLTIIAAAIVVAYLLYKYIIYPTFLSLFSAVPNAHFTSPFSYWWIRRARRGGMEGIKPIYGAHERKGAIVRLSPTEISVTSLEGLRTIYIGGFGRPWWFIKDLHHYKERPLFTMQHKRDHAERRRQMANVYAKSYVMKSDDMRILSNTIMFKRLLPVLDAATKNGGELDVMTMSRSAAMEFVTAYLYGLGATSNLLQDPEKAREVFRIEDEYIDGLFTTRPLVRESGEALGLEFCQAADQKTQRSPAEPETVPVVYSQLLKCQPKYVLDKTIPGTKIPAAVASEMLDHLLAGQEGARTTLSFLQWEMSKRPTLQSRLREELLSLNPPIRADSQKLPSFQDLDALPLLDAILTETLRRYPPTQALQYRETPPEGCTLHGYYIPGGITASTAPYCLHRNEEVFPNPLEWLPERWIAQNEEDEKRVKEMRRWFWAFGSGPMTCIGKHLIDSVMKMVVAAIYTSYTTTIVLDDDMEQCDAQLSKPVADKLILKLSPAI